MLKLLINPGLNISNITLRRKYDKKIEYGIVCFAVCPAIDDGMCRSKES
jgi:hypothetical protein